MNKSKNKGDRFEREIVHLAEGMGLKAYRNRMSRSPETDDSWDVSVAGRHLECKVRRDSFKKIRQWLIGNDGVVLGSDRDIPLVVIPLSEYLKLL